MAERTIEVDGVELCAEDFGDPGGAPILLIMGIGASMLWWEEGFCRMLAGRDRHVIRYDHRDTGRSVAYEPGAPGYSGADFSADAVRVLDGFGIQAAHLVGVSAGGGIAQEVALEHPERVLSLVLISTSPATAIDRGLPPPTAAFMEFLGSAEIDWSSRESALAYLVAYQRMLSGAEREFDESTVTDLVQIEMERARRFEAVQNHDLVAGDGGTDKRVASIAAPTLVLHGTADPMFPVVHGEALADEIPDARLVRLEGAGHGVYQADWETITAAIVEHTHA